MSLPLLAARATRRLQRRAKLFGLAAGALALLVIAVVAALGALPPTEEVVADQEIAGAAADIPPAYLAAYQRAARSVEPVIPWEILAGIGKVATDHGRRSPYDGTDRATAPATNYPDVTPPIVAHPGTPATGPAPASGAVRTLAAAIPAGATAPDSELATDVNNVPVFLAGERQVESGGDYQASAGGASGAYQYIDATWAEEARSAGYPQYAGGRAAAAPPEIQDAVAAYNAEQLFATFHSWWWAAEAWYDPLWAGDPAEQSSVPYPGAGNTLTMAGYAQKVYAAMAASTGTGSASATALPAGAASGAAASMTLGTAVNGAGPLLLTPAALAPAPGADGQDIDAEADLLARASAPVEERTWEQMNLPSSIVDRPLSDRDAQRFWSTVLAALPTAAGVGIGQLSTGGGAPPTGPTPSPSSSPAALPVQAGTDPMQRFATDLLSNLAMPVTPTNVAAIRAWASGEGSAARFNPLDTTQQEPGATPYNTNGSDPVENYPDYRSGVTATVATLQPGGHPSPLYGGILAALQAGSSTQAVEAAIASSPWGTQHFPDPNFTASNNFPGLPGSVPAGTEPVSVAAGIGPGAAAPGSSVPAGVDTRPAADALTMAEYYAGVISDPTPAAGRSYAPSPTLPAGYQVPAGTPRPVVQAIDMALAQLGKPYGYGATGPDSYDCSGLVMAAYAAAGISLPRTTYAQYLAGQAVPRRDPNQFRPGDLLFMMGSDPQGSAPGHVGMYLGAGQVIDAPYTGTVIRVSPLASWVPKLVSVRRLVPS